MGTCMCVWVGCLLLLLVLVWFVLSFSRLLRIAYSRRTPQSRLQELFMPTNQTVLLKLEFQKAK